MSRFASADLLDLVLPLYTRYITACSWFEPGSGLMQPRPNYDHLMCSKALRYAISHHAGRSALYHAKSSGEVL